MRAVPPGGPFSRHPMDGRHVNFASWWRLGQDGESYVSCVISKGRELRRQGLGLRDHIGGIRSLPRAEFIVADAEWRAMEQPRSELNGFLRRHVDLPEVRYRRIGFTAIADPALAPFTSAHDVMGDGTLLLLPVPGHTPGSTALLVRRPDRAPLLMVGDLTYGVDLLEAGRITGVGERAGLRTASAMVLRLKERHPDLVILPAHDPGAAERLRRANAG